MVSLNKKETDDDNDNNSDSNERKKRLKLDNNDEDISFFSMKKKYTQSRSNDSINNENNFSNMKPSSSNKSNNGPDLDLTDDDDDADSDKTIDKKPQKTSITEEIDDNESINDENEQKPNLDDEEIIPLEIPDVKIPISELESSEEERENDYDDVEIQDENQTELDPELLERIKQREEQLLAEKGDNSFSVGLVFRIRIPELNNQTIVTKIQSSDTFKTARNNLIQSLKKRKVFVSKLKYLEEVIETDAIFIWKSVKIFDFATPNLLHIRRTAPSMVIEVMFEEQFEELQHEAEERARESIEIKQKEEDDEQINDEETNNEEMDDNNDEKDDYFRVSMKGKDNIPVDVKVTSSTQISKLVEFYRSQRGLSAEDSIRLEFDDEILDVGSTVGDTELEEDFTIDVYVNS